MEVNLIVATGENGEIGRNGDLIWHISDDLKRFKALTTGHPVIMGRKTWESLPVKPLPGRRNIVLSSDASAPRQGAENVNSVEQALEATKGESPFVIGGAQVYKAFLPYVTRIYLTEILDSASDADVFLNLDVDKGGWVKDDESEVMVTKDGLKFRYLTFSRKVMG